MDLEIGKTYVIPTRGARYLGVFLGNAYNADGSNIKVVNEPVFKVTHFSGVAKVWEEWHQPNNLRVFNKEQVKKAYEVTDVPINSDLPEGWVKVENDAVFG